MASGEARVLQEQDQQRRRVRVMHQHKVPWSEVWDHNPRIAKPEEKGDFILHYARSLESNMRGYHSSKSVTQWKYNLAYRPQVGEIYFTDAEKKSAAQYDPDVIISAWPKPGASPNKAWIPGYWKELTRLAAGEGIRLTQFAYPGYQAMSGVGVIQTASFRQAAAVLARARAIVSIEGGMSHAAAALNVPGVILFGGFTPTSLTGYRCHINLGVDGDDACGMRTICRHCEAEMRKITPEQVFQHLKEILNGSN